MRNVFLPSSSTAETLVRLMLNTNLFALIFFYLLMFVGIAVVMVVLFETFLSGLRDVLYTRALNEASIIIGFIFSIWITSYARGYSIQAAKFSELLQSIENFAQRFFSIVGMYYVCQPTDINNSSNTVTTHQLVNNNNNNNNNVVVVVGKSNRCDKAQVLSFAAILNIVRDASFAFVSLGYRLFSNEESDVLQGLHEDITETIRDYQSYMDHNRAVHVYFALTRRIVYSIKILNERYHSLGTGDINALNKDLDAIRTILRETEALNRVHEPPLFNKIMFSSLAVYFLLWVPYVQWVLLGPVPTVLMYPIIMLLLTMPVIAFEWQGNAFSKLRPVVYMNFYNWRERAYARIADAFLDAIKHVPDHENQFDRVLDKITVSTYRAAKDVKTITAIHANIYKIRPDVC